MLLWKFRQLWPSLKHFFFFEVQSFFRTAYYCRYTTLPIFVFQLSKTKEQKMIPVRRHSSLLGFPRDQYTVLVLWQAFLTTALYDSQNKTSAMGRLPLVNAIMSTFWCRIFRRVDRYMAWIQTINTYFEVDITSYMKMKCVWSNASTRNNVIMWISCASEMKTY